MTNHYKLFNSMMVTNIFVNVAVKDLNKSMEFFKKIGWSFNPHFTDQNAAALVIGSNIYAMLLTEPFFKTFTKKELIDTSKNVEALFALSVESKDQVNELVNKALAAGATEPKPASDYGFMYSRDFEDLDGHTWEILWMDPEAAKNGPPKQ